MRALIPAIAMIAALAPGVASGQPAAGGEIAPNGKLRSASIAIRVLGGVADPVGKFIAAKLGVAFEPVSYPNPSNYAQSFGTGSWDIAIGPRALAGADKADTGADVWLIDLIYVATPGQTFASPSEVDRPGIKVGAIQGSPSDLFLSHNLKFAQLVRIPLSPRISEDAAELLRVGKADVFGADAGVSFPAAEALAGAKIVPGTFNVVRVAVSVPKGRSANARAQLEDIVKDAKRTGAVQNALDGVGLKGVRVAPE